MARGGGEAAQALQATVEVERILQADDTQKFREIKEERVRTQRQLVVLYSTLDSVIENGSDESSGDLVEVLNQIVAHEEERTRVLEAQRALVEKIAERAKRIDLLEARLNSMRQRVQEEAGALTGEWEVVLLPSGQRGRFRLEQSGTVVSGTYTLDGGWTGSLQGTLVSRKVYMVRIDSRLGRSMEFEGILSSGGTTIRGTWLNYDLAAEGGSQGQWSAERVGGGR
jgi:hypothetical protein